MYGIHGFRYDTCAEPRSTGGRGDFAWIKRLIFNSTEQHEIIYFCLLSIMRNCYLRIQNSYLSRHHGSVNVWVLTVLGVSFCLMRLQYLKKSKIYRFVYYD